MNEIQRVVDELRFILQREVIEKSDELTELLDQFSQNCHQANVRLRRCDEYVKQGLRSEALHLAEAKPNLLDVVAVLDFAEREELIDLVSMYFLTPPEPLLLEVATALNEAYAEHAPLHKLLDLHRVLAVGRAPLADRLIVLRDLADLDVASAHWEADVREMERARFAELDAESLEAMKSGNGTALKLFVAEIQAYGWRESIPSVLERNLKSRANQAVRGNARLRMKELSEQLYSAFSALDPVAARPLREEWIQKVQIAQANDSEPLCAEVAPILKWLEDEDRKLSAGHAFSNAVTAIESALDQSDATAADLRRLKMTADRLERSLPTSLESRFRSRLAAMETIEGRRRKLIFAGGFGAFVLVASGIGMVVYLSMEGEKIRRVVAAISTLIDDGKLEEAQKLIGEQGSHSTSEAWLTVKSKLSDAEKAERDRVMNWKAEMAAARESTEATRIEAALKQARQLSKTAEEKIELGKLQATWQKRVSEALALREKQCREGIASASSALQSIDTLLGSGESLDSDRVLGLIRDAEPQVARLVAMRGSVGKELASQATLIDARLSASRQAVANFARKTELLNKITDAVLIEPATVDSEIAQGTFEAAVREYLDAFPKDPRAAAFTSAAETSPIPAVTARQKLLRRWNRLQPNDVKDAETRVREIRTLFTEFPQTPDRELLGRYETWLVSILRRFAENGDPDEGVRQRVLSLFNSKFIREAHVVEDVDGKSYYLAKPETTAFGDVTSIVYQVGFNGETKQVTFSKNKRLKSDRSSAPPQQQIASSVRKDLKNITLEGWNDYFHKLTTTIVKSNEMNPFLRYLLVLKTLEFAGRGDSLLETELDGLLEKLNDDAIDRSVPWMDPESSTAKFARDRAIELLAEVPQLSPIFENAHKRQEQLERDLFSLRFSVGWLEKTSGGEWVCRSKWRPIDHHILYVASRPDSKGQRDWETLGRATGESLTVDPAVAQAVGEAAVVFTSRSGNETKTALIP